jgi:AsmA protein
MKKLAIFVAILVVVIVAVLLLAPAFISVNRFHDRIQAELQQRLHRPVQLGLMHLRLLPPRFSVDQAIIGEDPRFGPGPFATVQNLAISVKLLPLLHHDVELSGVDLHRPQVELIRDAQGQWNFSSLGAAPSQPPSGQPQPQKPSPAPPAGKTQGAPPLALDSLRITDGQVALSDYQKHQSRAVYDHIDLNLKNFAPDRAFDIDLTAHLPGKGAETVSLAGIAGPVNAAAFIETPFHGTLKLNSVLISGVQKFLNTQSLSQIEGMISGSASVKTQNGTVVSEGSLKIDGAQVRGTAVGYPISLNYNVSDNLNTDVLQIGKGDIRLGSTPLSISGTLNTRPTPAQVDLKLNAKDVPLAEAARLAAAFGTAFNSDTTVSGRASADINARGAISQPALNGSLSARDLSISGRDVPTPVKVSAIDLALTPNEIRSNQFNASAANTNLGVQFTLTNYTSPAPQLSAAVRTNNAQITDLVNIARAWDPGLVQDVSGSGLLSLDVQAAGALKNATGMNFSGSGQVQNASLKTAGLRQPLSVRNANLRFTQNSAELQNLAASFAGTTATGNATVRNFSAPNVQFALRADKVNVAQLQEVLRATPPSSQPPKRQASFSLIPWVHAEAPPGAVTPAGGNVLASMTGGGTLHLDTIQHDQFVLTNTDAKVALDHGVVRLTPVTAQLYDGQETGTITVDTRPTPMKVQANNQLQHVRANDLISALTSLKDTIYGTLAANSNLAFQVPAKADDLARTLNGTLALDLSNGRITKLDLINELAAIGKFAGLRKNAQAVTDFTRLAGHFTITNGVASTNDLRADIANGSLAANGTVDLATQQLNLHVISVLSKGFTQSVGGTGIGGLMQTALANNRGELVMPVLITGTFDKPQVVPDTQKLAQMKLQNLLPTSGNPGALTTGPLGSILKGGNSGQQGGVSNILNSITGQQKQQPASGQPPEAQTQTQQKSQQGSDMLNQAIGSILGGKKQQKQQQQSPPPK